MTAPLPAAREIALRVLDRIERESAFANLALDGAFRDWPAPKQERAFCTEMVYGTVRHRLTLDWMLHFYCSRPVEKLTPVIRNILRLSLYQLAIMNHKPEAAVVNEAVTLATKHGPGGTSGLVNAILRAYLRDPQKVKFPDLRSDPARHISLRFSHPEWLVERWLARFGVEDTVALCERNNTPAPVTIRTNTLVTGRENLLERLASTGVQAEPTSLAPEGLTISGFDRLESLDAYKEGWFTVQDESSMLVAHALSPEPGEDVIDLCGAPGGKTTHIAQLMENRGRILSVDLRPHRIRLIEQTAERLGISIIATKAVDALEFDPPDGKPVHALLLDAPCTGTGVLGRRADARWRKTPGELTELASLQRKLLSHAATLVAPGGHLVYSTCSLEPEENHLAIEEFLGEHPEFSPGDLRGCLPESVFKGSGNGEPVSPGWMYLLPWRHGTDGFFIARLERRA